MIGIWFNGIASLINYMIPEKNIYAMLVLCIIPLVFFYLDDSNLNELYKIDDIRASAIINATSINKHNI